MKVSELTMDQLKAESARRHEQLQRDRAEYKAVNVELQKREAKELENRKLAQTSTAELKAEVARREQAVSGVGGVKSGETVKGS